MKHSLYKVLALGAAIAASATLAKADPINGSISVTGPSIFYFNSVPTYGSEIYFPNDQGTYQISAVPASPNNDFSVFTVNTAVNWEIEGGATPPAGTVPTGSLGPAGGGPAYSGGYGVPLGTYGAVNTPPGGSLGIFSVTEGSNTLSFTMTSEQWSEQNVYYTNGAPNPACTASSSACILTYEDLTINGGGYFDLTDYDQTDGSFNFTINQPVDPNGNPDGPGYTQDATFSGSGVVAGVAPTPEPSSLALLGTGLLGAAAIARRRFRTRLSA